MPGTSQATPLVVRWMIALAVVIIAWYLLMAFAYARAPSFLDHFEPSIALGALRVLAGEQAFHDPQNAAQYASIYGPNAYLVPAVWVAMWPEVIAGSKLAGAFAGVTFCVLFTVACVRRHGPAVAVMQLALTVAGGLLFGHASYWNRPEPLQLIGIALALLSLTCRGPYGPAVALGLAITMLVNLKIHSPLYVLPVIAVLVHQRHWRVLTLGAVVAIVGFSTPFLASELFSLPNYVGMLFAASQHPRSFELLGLNILYLVFFTLPLVADAVLGRRSSSDEAAGTFGLTLGGVGVLVCVIGSKSGAGPHHLLPLLPLVAWGLGRPIRAFVDAGALRPRYAVVATMWIVVLLWFGARVQLRVWTSIEQDQGRRVIADLQAIRATYAQSSIQMGPAGGDQRSLYWYRPALRSRNPVDFLDVTTWMDTHLSGHPMPTATLNALEQGQVDVWLIPKGGVPFTLTSYYPPHGPLFTPEFRRSFELGYRWGRSSDYFDVYLPR